MTPVAWMVGLSLASWLVTAPWLGTRIAVEVLFGMLGPLVVASGTWVLTERTYRRRPERLTSLMVMAFGAKIVFFGAYVTVAVSVLSPRPVPFIVSFTSYFIALHFIEALYLRRLFMTPR